MGALRRVAQVRQAREQLLRALRIARAGGEGSELDFGDFLVSSQLLDSLAHELRLDSRLERLDLLADPGVEVGDLISQLFALR